MILLNKIDLIRFRIFYVFLIYMLVEVQGVTLTDKKIPINLISEASSCEFSQ